MARLIPTPEVLENILSRIPEGFIRHDQLCQRIKLDRNTSEALVNGRVGRHDDLWYDTARLTAEDLSRVRAWSRPVFPEMTAKGVFLEATIDERAATRREWLLAAANPAAIALLEDLTRTPGYAAVKDLCGSDREREQSLRDLLDQKLLRRHGDYVYDPLRLSLRSMREITGTSHPSSPASPSRQHTWEDALQECGQTLRPGAREGKSARMRVIGRSYVLAAAARRLGVRDWTLEQAVREGRLPVFTDPERRQRIPAEAVEAAIANPEYAEQITAYEKLSARDISIVAGVSYSTARRRLLKAGISPTYPRWGQVRGRWELPDTLREFYLILKERTELHRLERRQQAETEQRIESARRQELRARLVAAFPTWRHENRAEQRIYLHVGPPNSGKTHEALEALAEAGSGWYLAPLRLLAFEIFDRLNQRGVYCNLLTGEEHIPIPGATITAATVEMFNPHNSGQCVVIDEAQMLADPDRGWAWTRALMEAEAPDIHVIGPATAQGLIEQLGTSAGLPVSVIEHQRLAPIQIAESNWPLHELPPRTILVAFSRATVLHLKTELERMKRTVSVVYGNLPPEVRRKQADRFAAGETDICVATDAVGMGLNLPADFVCFYEVEKYDGHNTRLLTPAEVQQIGGRAGRFGLSEGGQIGATTRSDLKTIRRLYQTPAPALTHARVAPTVEDLELIPGSLAGKLTQWASLQSIPDDMRAAIQTADMTERIELASMLTDREVKLLGLEAALKLVNAPARQSSRNYWYQCTRAILTDRPLPQPPVAPRQVTNTIELESIEFSVACADIYLWLSQRREFAGFAPDEPHVRLLRAEWSRRIDLALLRKISTVRRCSRCRTPLPLKHPYGICDRCYRGRFADYDFN